MNRGLDLFAGESYNELKDNGVEADMWYVVWVRTGQEEATRDMCRLMIEDMRTGDDRPVYEECFIPKKEKAWRQNGEWTNREVVLFPGYLFFDAQDPAALSYALKTIPEFTKILGDDDGPIALPKCEEDILVKYMNRKHVIEMSVGELVGGKLIITSGPMKDYEGEVVRIDRRMRTVTLKVEFLGEPRDVTIGLAVVRKVD